jgi:hypothetical protein
MSSGASSAIRNWYEVSQAEPSGFTCASCMQQRVHAEWVDIFISKDLMVTIGGFRASAASSHQLLGTTALAHTLVPHILEHSTPVIAIDICCYILSASNRNHCARWQNIIFSPACVNERLGVWESLFAPRRTHLYWGGDSSTYFFPTRALKGILKSCFWEVVASSLPMFYSQHWMTWWNDRNSNEILWVFSLRYPHSQHAGKQPPRVKRHIRIQHILKLNSMQCNKTNKFYNLI